MPDTVVKPTTTRVTDKMMQLWAAGNLNVLLIGRHGTGKSTMVLDFWQRGLGLVEGQTFKYLSAATLDPWVDLVGIPKENGDGTIKFIQPKWLSSVQCIFLDECNRSHPKVRNALMEMIQFHSVNGAKLPNLKFIWAAINPEDDEDFQYDVDRLDPATKDRFHVHIYMPFEPSFPWFASAFSDSDMASAIINWWKNQNENVQKQIPPRRLEYCVRHIQSDGDVRHIIPDAIANGASFRELVQAVRGSSPVLRELKNLFTNRDEVGAKKFIADENNYVAVIQEILRDKQLVTFYLPLMPPEKISALLSQNDNVLKFVLDNKDKYDNFSEILNDIFTVNKETYLSLKIAEKLEKKSYNNQDMQVNPDADVWPGSEKDNCMLLSYLEEIDKETFETTFARKQAYSRIRTYMPVGDLEENVAYELLQKLDVKIIGRSHIMMVAKNARANGDFYGIMGIINAAVKAIYNSGFSFNNIRGKYPKLWRLIHILRNKFYFVP